MIFDNSSPTYKDFPFHLDSSPRFRLLRLVSESMMEHKAVIVAAPKALSVGDDLLVVKRLARDQTCRPNCPFGWP
jgi:hypothetical protein